MQGFNYQVPAVSFGSGSLQTASLNVEVVTDEEQVQAEQVHPFGFGERQGFPDEPGQALPDGVVEPLDMVGQAGLFTDRPVLFVGDDVLIGLLEVSVDDAPAVVLGNGTPQLLARRLAPPADHASHNLPGRPTNRQP